VSRPVALADVALAYARASLWVLLLHEPAPESYRGVVGEAWHFRCSCDDRGCPAFARHPRLALTDATSDARRVAAWWRAWPTANIGASTGRGMVALHVERDGGEGALLDLEEHFGPLPATVAIVTGEGGRFLVFRMQRPVPSRQLAQGLALLGEGGFVVLPPSRTESQYVRDSAAGRQVVPLPAWLAAGEPGP
jgi:hypothetical protein